ncbi:MAG TPA: FCD domain-containing protein [Burkholderiaceae bacterium]|nr:FCD domain-containing protein [Burkholderiaceae bacterium]
MPDRGRRVARRAARRGAAGRLSRRRSRGRPADPGAGPRRSRHRPAPIASTERADRVSRSACRSRHPSACRSCPPSACRSRRCSARVAPCAAFARKTRAFLQDLRALHRIYCEVLGGETDRRRLGMLVDKAFHMRIAEQAGNPHLTALLGNVFDRLILTRPLEGFPVNRMRAALDEHAAILAAFEGDSARAAEEAMLANVDRGCRAIVDHMQRIQDFSLAL